uniref:DUF6883 domain-containing protein n=1 Tax=Leptospira alexanderi TaxID=100053 RepID=UPI000990D8D1
SGLKVASELIRSGRFKEALSLFGTGVKNWVKGSDVIVGNGAVVNPSKFSDYIFKENAVHGKNTVFESLGYSKENTTGLVKIFEEQAAAKFKAGEYTLGKLDQYGQRINIEIQLPGIGNSVGKTSYIQSGWMLQPDGTITLNTPFSGFTK